MRLQDVDAIEARAILRRLGLAPMEGSNNPRGEFWLSESGHPYFIPSGTRPDTFVKEVFRGEMARQNVTYAQLVERLAEVGVHEDERNLRNKVSRGKFTAAFLLQCLAAIGVHQLHLEAGV